ncbi:glycosyltransferase family 2 protein [Mediterraneibacter gnavus]|uniref:glycosyltransferase family 2 protein n=1 Tax=Mediterraneibacter gnavus TaxID=33038 RepID=UPI00232D2944|nr:glycosyltransferase family 2 protein [Mediterraneibacter gnavus]MDB8711938.1 glycosyltransferase family 2 protein [Mediterraneibacter gnavus]MDB8714968.1 glycosyltransferase family 2 protein [Mediterraneibacter gnavus]
MISVVIPTYNRAKTIKDAVGSVLCQTYSDLEVIIVDDASTDETEDIIKEIPDSRIKYIKLENNSGACNARNMGALAARGEYVAFQDSDDQWNKNKLEKQYRFMRDNKLDFCFCGMTRIMLEDPNKSYYYPNIDMDDQKSYFEQLLYLNRVGTQTIMCKRSCFEQVQFDTSLERFQDWDYALQIAKKFNMGYLRESLVDSYIQQDSISKNAFANKKAWRALYDKYIDDIQKNPIIHAKYLFRIGNEIVLFDIKSARQYYEKSLKMHQSKTTLIFYVLSVLKMKNIIKNLLRYQRNRLFKKSWSN